jgi:hypothetical protein
VLGSGESLDVDPNKLANKNNDEVTVDDILYSAASNILRNAGAASMGAVFGTATGYGAANGASAGVNLLSYLRTGEPMTPSEAIGYAGSQPFAAALAKGAFTHSDYARWPSFANNRLGGPTSDSETNGASPAVQNIMQASDPAESNQELMKRDVTNFYRHAVSPFAI